MSSDLANARVGTAHCAFPSAPVAEISDAVSTESDGTSWIRLDSDEAQVSFRRWRQVCDVMFYSARRSIARPILVYRVGEDDHLVSGKPFAFAELQARRASVWSFLKVSSRCFQRETPFGFEDSTFSDPGSVGLWIKADSVTAFHDVCLWNEMT
jgi:hypothetical protein